MTQSKGQVGPVKVEMAHPKGQVGPVWKSDFFSINRSELGPFATHKFTQARQKCGDLEED